MQPLRPTWILPALSFFATLVAISLLTGCPNTPLEPKAQLPEVTIQVLDRFDQPVPHDTLKVQRKVDRPMSFQPSEFVAEAVTNQTGLATFQNLKEDDWISATSPDFRFSGRITLKAGQSNYTLKINHAALTSTSFHKEVDPLKFEKETQQVISSINKILAHFVETRQTDFQSPTSYVSQKIITQDEANRLIEMGKRMNDTPTGINFLWGSSSLRVPSFDQAILWIDPAGN